MLTSKASESENEGDMCDPRRLWLINGLIFGVCACGVFWGLLGWKYISAENRKMVLNTGIH